MDPAEHTIFKGNRRRYDKKTPGSKQGTVIYKLFIILNNNNIKFY